MLQRIIDSLKDFLYTAPIVLICITFHEYAHGFVAYKFGDNTAKEQGRLTLNPIKHIDPLGAIFFLIFHFGWAKPVPVRPLYFKNPKRDMAIVAIAGPATNFLLTIIAVPFVSLSLVLSEKYSFPYLTQFFSLFLIMNIGFALFNLLPIPPLDGSRILAAFLPAQIYNQYLRYEQYAFIVLIILMFTGVFNTIFGTMISFAIDILQIPIVFLYEIIYRLI